MRSSSGVDREELSWEFLVRQPYGICLWDIPLIRGKREVVFMAREREADVRDLPERVPCHFKAGLLGMGRVFPVVVLIDFIPLRTIYEVYFNFCAPEGAEAIALLGRQPNLYLAFYDRGPEAVRIFGFVNNMASYFRLVYVKLKGLPCWTDDEFDRAKEWLMQRYTVEDLEEML